MQTVRNGVNPIQSLFIMKHLKFSD